MVGEMRMRVMSRSYRHQSSAVVAPPKARSAERIREEGQGRGRTPRAGSVSTAAAVGGGCLLQSASACRVAHLLGLRERLALVCAPCRLDLGRRTREQLGRLLLRTPLSLRRLLGEPRERRLGLRLEPTPAPR